MQMKYRKLDLENCICITFSLRQEVRKLTLRGNTLITHMDNIFSPNLLHTLYHLQVTTMRFRGSRWSSGFRHCATNRKVAGSIPRWCHSKFSLIYPFRPHYGPGIDPASNRNEYQEYFLGGKGGRCVGLATLPPSCADCLEIWEPQPPGILWACPGP